MRHTERCGPRRGARLRAAALIAGLAFLGAAAGAGEAQTSGPLIGTTRVVALEGQVVVLGAGREDGLREDASVTLLREGDPIVHPLTGEALGTPQEPVGTVQLLEVGDRRARGTMAKVYSAPRAGDIAEYDRVAPRLSAPAPALPPEPPPAVAEVLRKVEQLEGSLAEYRSYSQDVRTYPEFARRVGDELAAMQSYLRSMDRRLEQLEKQRGEDHSRLTSALSLERPAEEMKEFTIRYTPDTQVRLRAAGRTLLISVVRDSLRMVEMEPDAPVAAAAPAAFAEEPGDAPDGALDDELLEAPPPEPGPADTTAAATAPWYESKWHLAAGVGLLFALLITVTLIIRRRYNDVMEGLDDLDDELLESDDPGDDLDDDSGDDLDDDEDDEEEDGR